MNRAFFIFVFIVTVFFLTIESVIGYVSDYLVEQNTSLFGISLFTCISAIFVISSFVFLLFMKDTTSEIRGNSKAFRVLYYATSTTQIVLVGLLVAVVVQVASVGEYSTVLLIITSAVGPTVAAVVMIASCLILFSWFNFNRRSYVVLIFTMAFALNAYVFVYTSVAGIYTRRLCCATTPPG